MPRPSPALGGHERRRRSPAGGVRCRVSAALANDRLARQRSPWHDPDVGLLVFTAGALITGLCLWVGGAAFTSLGVMIGVIVAMLALAAVMARASARWQRRRFSRIAAIERVLAERAFVVERALLSRSGDWLLALDPARRVALCEVAVDGTVIAVKQADTGEASASLHEDASGFGACIGLRGRVPGRPFWVPIAAISDGLAEPAVAAFLQQWTVALASPDAELGPPPLALVAQVSSAERRGLGIPDEKLPLARLPRMIARPTRPRSS